MCHYSDKLTFNSISDLNERQSSLSMWRKEQVISTADMKSLLSKM